MYNIAYTERFLKSYNKLTSQEQSTFSFKMKLFIENTVHPSLRTRKIQGIKIYMNQVLIWT
jgi:mRNA-degrading endonuclease RelE of RelBE toxin-antitoxin system